MWRLTSVVLGISTKKFISFDDFKVRKMLAVEEQVANILQKLLNTRQRAKAISILQISAQKGETLISGIETFGYSHNDQSSPVKSLPRPKLPAKNPLNIS